jgi:hypothetical protein
VLSLNFDSAFSLKEEEAIMRGTSSSIKEEPNLPKFDDKGQHLFLETLPSKIIPLTVGASKARTTEH